jgi:tetratricopeptide (TPR) repeat protein
MKAGKKHDAGNGAEPANTCPPAAASQSTEPFSNIAEAHTDGNYNTVTQVVGSDHVNITINNKSASKPLLPMQIAPPPPDFTGREEELKELVDAVQKGGTTISGLRGMGGIGKTALAQKIAQTLKADFPDGHIYLDLKGAKGDEEEVAQNLQPLTAGGALDRIISSYGYEVSVNATVDERAALYRTILAEKRVLLLMDNARDDQQVKRLIPPGGSVLIVQNFTLPGLFAKNLDTLPRARACELLLKIEPRIGNDADQIARLCGDLRLALRAAASALENRRDLSLAEFLGKMKDAEGRVRETGVKLAFTTSSELLDPALRELWFQLAVFPSTFDPAGAAAVWQTEPPAAKEALSRLGAFNLVQWNPATNRYRLHDLARDFTTLQLDDTTRIAAQGRHAEHYKTVLAAADGLYLKGGPSILEGLTLFDFEWGNIQAGQACAAAHRERDRLAAQLCEAYPIAHANVLSLRQPPRERINWLEAALDSARTLANRSCEGAALGNLGLTYYSLGEYRRAIGYYEQHLAIARELNDRFGEGGALGNLGDAYHSLGEYRRGIEFHQQYLMIARELGNRRGEGIALGGIGNACDSLAEYRRAIEFHQQRLAIAREIGNRFGEGNALGDLGNAYLSLGEYRRAIESHQQQLTIARELGHRRGEGNALGSLSNAYLSLGEHRRAIGFFEQALTISREIGDRRGEGQTFGNLGNTYYALGEYRRAIEFHQQYLTIARAIGDRSGEGNSLFNSALALDQIGQREEAIQRAKQALSIFEQIESPTAEKVRRQIATWKQPS